MSLKSYPKNVKVVFSSKATKQKAKIKSYTIIRVLLEFHKNNKIILQGKR